MAAALGVAPTTLLHRFGSKEQMIQEVQRRLRERILAETAPAPGDAVSLAAYVRTLWQRTSRPDRAGEFRLFFATYGRALQAPDRYRDFLAHVVADATSAVRAVPSGVDDAEVARTATLVVAVLRGLLLDLLATGDRDRVQAAADAFIAGLQAD